MTQVQWQYLETVLADMTAEDKQRLASMLTKPPVAETTAQDPLIGALADEPELLDQIMESVYHARETHPLRASD